MDAVEVLDGYLQFLKLHKGTNQSYFVIINMADNNNNYKFLTHTLLSILFMLCIGIYSWLCNRLLTHEALPGHPVTVQKINYIEQDIREIKCDLKQILEEIRKQ